MDFADIKDVVRGILGKRDIEPYMMSYLMESGRRRIEKDNNWYYMRKTKDFTLTVGKQAYSVKAGGDIDEANFKDSRILMYRHPDQHRFYEVPSSDRNQLDLQFATDDSWEPEMYTLDDEDGLFNLLIYPGQPNLAYNMRWHYYVWTTNPASDTATDELVSRWPELLIAASVAQGYRILAKDDELAMPWDGKLTAEMQALKRYDYFRMESERNMLIPRRGPFHNSRDISSGNRKIFY